MRRRALLAMLLGSLATATTSCGVAPTRRSSRDDGYGWWNRGWDDDYDDGSDWNWSDGDRRRNWPSDDDWPRQRRRARRRRRERQDRDDEGDERPDPPQQDRDPPPDRDEPPDQPRVYPPCGFRGQNPYDC